MTRSPRRQTPESKRRKRRRRIASALSFSLTMVVLAWVFEIQATTTVMFVRHAETDGAMVAGGNPTLNARGRRRAEMLADYLVEVDVLASLDVVYASEFRRTQQTAEPLAERLGLEILIDDHYDSDPFMDRVLDRHKGDIVLVVTHSDTLGDLVAALHGHQSVPEIAPDEYDNLYIVTIPSFGRVKTLRFRYAPRWQPGPDAYFSH